MRVFGWAADDSGCGYYRLGLPFQQLRDVFGWEAMPTPIKPAGIQDWADVIVGQRVCLPGPTHEWQVLNQRGYKTVLEVDDDLWHVRPDNEIAGEYFNQPGVVKRLTANVAAATAVTVTNERLAEIVSEFNSNVIILPNYIDHELLSHKRPHADNGKITLGWAGSLSHYPDFVPVAPRLRRFLDRHPQVEMHIMGADYSYLIKREIRHTGWNKEVIEMQRSIDFDIGIAPLLPQLFNRSKSYVKALEYAALGIPCVATDFYPYSDFIIHGETGFLVKQDHEWEKYLHMLVTDEALREEMGRKAREHATAYTIQGNAYRWRDAYWRLVNGSNAEPQLAEATPR